MSEALFHVVAPADWPATGMYRPRSLDTEGFVHCSYAGQVAGTLERHFAGVDRSALVVLELDPARVGPVRVEGGFPHVHGPIPVEAALARHPATGFPPTGQD